jgi:signal transduction histidine kinase
MGQTEMIIFLVLINIVVLVFIAGIIVFIIQYRRRKVIHENEKAEIEKQHRLNLLNTELLIQKQTMQFIGEEIHDSVAQKLTLAAIYIQQMEIENFSAQANQKLFGINKVLKDSLDELRYISKDLTGNRLQSADLAELIRVECSMVNATGICTASSETDTLPEMNIAAKSSLYRIVQEFLQNSIKHAGCKYIKVKAVMEKEYLIITLEDDGKGFEIDKVRKNGIGLDNIRRRVSAMEGTYNFTSQPGNGVCLSISVAYKKIITPQ